MSVAVRDSGQCRDLTLFNSVMIRKCDGCCLLKRFGVGRQTFEPCTFPLLLSKVMTDIKATQACSSKPRVIFPTSIFCFFFPFQSVSQTTGPNSLLALGGLLCVLAGIPFVNSQLDKKLNLRDNFNLNSSSYSKLSYLHI